MCPKTLTIKWLYNKTLRIRKAAHRVRLKKRSIYMILHITTHKEWKNALLEGEYTAPTLKSNGFIHCSTLNQAADTANIFFKGQNGLTLLCIDENKLKSECKYEDPTGGGKHDSGVDNLFPHIYGPINTSAVIKSVDFPANENGLFVLPKELIDMENPESYLKFGDERTQPSIDLVNRIKMSSPPQNILDIGCGPGNSSRILTDRWPSAKLVGLDSSPNMIEKAKKDYPQREWILSDASTFSPMSKFDIVFSNATIQWIPNHENLLKQFCAMLSDNGVLAFQIPLFRDMPISKAIAKVAQMERWRIKTSGCSNLFTYHDYGFYFDRLSKELVSVELWETYYLHVLESQLSIIEWTKSTAMKPYLDCLSNDTEKTEFEEEVLLEVKKEYPCQENGKVIFPFKRLFVIGYKSK
jgi:trans-aconitate 2-methyltransferase